MPVQALDLPAPDALQRAVQARLPGFAHVQWVASTGSTNADLLARARHGRGLKPGCWAPICRRPAEAALAAPGKTAAAPR